MILVDTSVWIAHLRLANLMLTDTLLRQQVYTHAFVVGEISLGSLKNRSAILSDLQCLPHVRMAQESEVAHMIEAHRFFGQGIGYIDAHLLASCLITGQTRLWTFDQKLQRVAEQLGIAHDDT
jgi:predicted nucleic acid-binding protein